MYLQWAESARIFNYDKFYGFLFQKIIQQINLNWNRWYLFHTDFLEIFNILELK